MDTVVTSSVHPEPLISRTSFQSEYNSQTPLAAHPQSH